MNMLFEIHFMQFQASKFIICFCIHANKDQIWMLKKKKVKIKGCIFNSSIWLEPFILILRDSCVWSFPKFYGCDMISLVEGFETVKGDIPALPAWLRQGLEYQKFEHRITNFLLWPNLKCKNSRENWGKWKLIFLCIFVFSEHMCHHVHYESQKNFVFNPAG